MRVSLDHANIFASKAVRAPKRLTPLCKIPGISSAWTSEINFNAQLQRVVRGVVVESFKQSKSNCQARA